MLTTIIFSSNYHSSFFPSTDLSFGKSPTDHRWSRNYFCKSLSDSYQEQYPILPEENRSTLGCHRNPIEGNLMATIITTLKIKSNKIFYYKQTSTFFTWIKIITRSNLYILYIQFGSVRLTDQF